jgi:hypothetical protein
MRIYEINKTQRKQPEVFLDMDGVLADFFHEYAKLAGVPEDERGRHDYHLIPPKLREPVINQMVGTDFFYRLPKFGSADKLVAMIVKLFGSYSICSSPLRGDHENSGAMKRAWIAENLNPQPVNIVITPRKGKYAKQPDGTPNILIDDRGSNITEWEASGGIGIKYQADENGLDTVARGLRRAIEILKGQRDLEPQQLVSKDHGAPVATAQDQPVNESSMHEHEERIHHFMAWCKAKLKLKQELPDIEFSDEKDSEDMHHTGYYNDHENKLWVYTGNRNLIDILRTVAHEFTHRKQGEDGRIEGPNPPGSPLEQEADAMAGYLMKLYGKMYPEIVE